MFCPKCGINNGEGATFCAGCGAPLQETQAPSGVADIQQRRKSILVMAPQPRVSVGIFTLKNTRIGLMILCAIALLFYLGFPWVAQTDQLRQAVGYIPGGDAALASMIDQFFGFTTGASMLGCLISMCISNFIPTITSVAGDGGATVSSFISYLMLFAGLIQMGITVVLIVISFFDELMGRKGRKGVPLVAFIGLLITFLVILFGSFGMNSVVDGEVVQALGLHSSKATLFAPSIWAYVNLVIGILGITISVIRMELNSRQDLFDETRQER